MSTFDLYSGMAAFATVALVTFSWFWWRARRRLRKAAEEAPQISASSLDNISELLTENYRNLNAFYSQNLAIYRTSSLTSVGIASFGFLAILGGAALAIKAHIGLGVATSLAGLVSEAASILIFRQNAEFRKQMEMSQKQLVTTQDLMTTIVLARDLEGTARTKELLEINSFVRRLILERGGSVVPHESTSKSAANQPLPKAKASTRRTGRSRARGATKKGSVKRKPAGAVAV